MANMDTETLYIREKILKKIFAKLINFVDLKHTLYSIIDELKEYSGFEAISIRLREEEDYPYYVFKGFPESFIQKESFLCPHHSSSSKEDNRDKSDLECLCGNIILGKTDTTKSYYTSGGSYWTNSSTKNIPHLLNNEPDTKIRNYCSAVGYESIGLFPITTRNENIGLIQLNDRRKDLFTQDLVDFFEMIGEQIGISIENATLYEKIKEKNTILQQTVDKLDHAQNHLLEAKKMNTLADMVTGISHDIYHPITNSLQELEKLLSKTRQLSSNANPELAEIIEKGKSIQHNIASVKNLVSSFRAVAFDQFQESRHLINLHNFMYDIIKIAQPTLKDKQIDFEVDCNTYAEILSFSGVLSQILNIFIKNSYYHGFRNRSEGKITISCALNDENFIDIRFSDNGNGVEKKNEYKIFEPFFSTDRKNHTGLGLYNAQSLANSKLKGEIIFDSSAQTTDFIIRIPT
jgi:signal transduction histidine kinase